MTRAIACHGTHMSLAHKPSNTDHVAHASRTRIHTVCKKRDAARGMQHNVDGATNQTPNQPERQDPWMADQVLLAVQVTVGGPLGPG